MNSFFTSITSATSVVTGDHENGQKEDNMEQRLNDVLSTISTDQFESIANQLLWSNNNNNNMIEEEEKMTFVIALIARISRTKRDLASLLLRCIVTVSILLLLCNRSTFTIQEYIHYSLFIIHYSLLITHYSLLITHSLYHYYHF